MGGLRRGEATYRRAVLAMVAAGLASFNTLYATQALLPIFTDTIGISPSQAALTVSAATGAVAICIVPASILSERFGRGTILIPSVLCAASLGILLPWLPSFEAFLIGRALQGILLAGVPAVAMAWLSEELSPSDLGHAMGLYVAGTSIGGLLGRFIPATLVELVSWQYALCINSGIALMFALTFIYLLPPQQRFQPKPLGLRSEIEAMVGHWSNPRLAALFITGFLNMGAFVSLFNYIGYRMVSHFNMSEALTGALFLLFLSGTWSSARAGTLVQRHGAGKALLGLTAMSAIGLFGCLTGNLGVTVIGLLLFTAGFFAIHSTASGMIGNIATIHRAEASSMYLFCYYCGSSAIGWSSGYLFTSFGWHGLIIGLLFLMLMLGSTAYYFARRN